MDESLTNFVVAKFELNFGQRGNHTSWKPSECEFCMEFSRLSTVSVRRSLGLGYISVAYLHGKTIVKDWM